MSCDGLRCDGEDERRLGKGVGYILWSTVVRLVKTFKEQGRSKVRGLRSSSWHAGY